MKTLGLLARQIGYEQKLYWRSPSSAVFTFAFPILLLVIFASLNMGVTLRALGINYNQYYVPGIVAFSVISACYTTCHRAVLPPRHRRAEAGSRHPATALDVHGRHDRPSSS
jgi:ABC-2 type transport system permease protein